MGSLPHHSFILRTKSKRLFLLTALFNNFTWDFCVSIGFEMTKPMEPSFFKQLKASVLRIHLKKRRRRVRTMSEVCLPLSPLVLILISRTVIPKTSFTEIYVEKGEFDIWNSKIFRERIMTNRTTRAIQYVVLTPDNDGESKTESDIMSKLHLYGETMKVSARQFFVPPLDLKVKVENATAENITRVSWQENSYFAVVKVNSLLGPFNYTVTMPTSSTSYSVPIITEVNETKPEPQCRMFDGDKLPVSNLSGNCDAVRYFRSGFVSLVALINFSWMKVR